MPHLDTSTYASQFFWLVICFMTLYTIVSLFIVPRLKSTVGNREDLINSHLTEAKRLKEEAEVALSEYEKAIEKANLIAKDAQEKTMQELNQFINGKQDELQKELRTQIDTAEKSFAKSRNEAIKEAEAIAEKLSKEVISKLDI